MPNVSHDESTVRAVIKGGITEWQNKDKKIRDEELRRITSPKGQLTRKRTFQALKNMMEKSHRGYILSTHTIKDKLRTHKHCFLIHFDFEMSQTLYKGNYPELFFVSMTGITTKGNFRKEEFVRSFAKTMVFMCLTSHCIERIVKRNACEDLKQITNILKPLSTASIVCFLLFDRADRKEQSKRRVLVGKDGYAVFGWEEKHNRPVVVTWLPIHWWEESQHTKLDRLIEALKKSKSEWVMIDEEKFNKPRWIDPESIPQENFLFWTWEQFWKDGSSKTGISSKWF